MTAFHVPSQVIRFKCANPSLEVKTDVASALRLYDAIDRMINAKVIPSSFVV